MGWRGDLAEGFERHRGTLIRAVAVPFALFQLYTVGFGVLTPLAQRGSTLLFAATLAFLMFPLADWPRAKDRAAGLRIAGAALDAALVALAAWTCLYVIRHEAALANRSGAETQLDLLIAVLGPLMLLEMVRRTVGQALAAIMLVVLVYTYYGDIVLVIGVPLALAAGAWALRGWRTGAVVLALFAGSLLLPEARALFDSASHQYQGVSLYRMAPYLWLTSEGTFGSIAGIMSQFIFIFVLFAAFLESLGSGKILIDLAFSGTGRLRGGPAQAAVAASSMFGMVSGSTMANVVSTGTLTIPLMVRAGFQRTFAAAVEAVASSGGQIVPPIMGASVFIMAEIVGVPYSHLMLYALLPAFLYFLSLASCIYFEAGRLGIGRMPDSDIPQGRKAFFTGGFVILPLLVLLLSIIAGETPGLAGYKAVVALLVMSDLIRAFLMLRDRHGMRAAYACAAGVGALLFLAFGPIPAPPPLETTCVIPLLGEVPLNRLILVASAVAVLAVPALRALPVLLPLWLAIGEWRIDTSYPLLGEQSEIVIITVFVIMAIAGAALVLTPCSEVERGQGPSLSTFLQRVLDGLVNGSRNAVSLVAATFGIGLIVGLLVLTGLGVRLSILVSQVAAHSLFLSFVLVMLASLILGMGLPTVAAYLLLVMVVAPSMEQLGTHIVAAHMFVFYFGVLSSITPPVALAAFGAAGIARVAPLETAVTACRLALSAFIVPFLFVYYPELLLLQGGPVEVIYRLAVCGLGVWLLAAGVIGYGLGAMSGLVRALAIAAALLLFLSPPAANAAGALIASTLIGAQYIGQRRLSRA